jgi:hypothetical protein
MIMAIATMLPLLAGLLVARAAEPTGTLTLACEGTATGTATDNVTEPISMGIIVDFKAGKIDGFGKSLPAEIRTIDETTIVFSANDNSRSVEGNMDRITGNLRATSVIVGSWSMTYELKCKPTQRMF